MGCGDSSLKNFDGFTKSLDSNKYKQIIVITGNLVSQKAGVPNILPMRSSEQSAKVVNYDEITTLLEPVNYDNVPHYEQDHAPFYEMYRTLINKDFSPISVHGLLVELNKRGILLVNLTTNIDGLAQKAGVPDSRVYEINGHYRQSQCIVCWEKGDIEDFNAAVLSGDSEVKCKEEDCSGKMKPCLHFGKQDLETKFTYASMLLAKTDLIIMIGVNPTMLVKFLQKKPSNVPLVLMNPIKHNTPATLYLEGHPEKLCQDMLQKLSPQTAESFEVSEIQQLKD